MSATAWANSESLWTSAATAPLLTAGATTGSFGISKLTARPRTPSTSSFVSPTFGVTRLSTRLVRDAGKPSMLERAQAQLHVLQRRDVEAAEHQQLVGLAQHGEHRPVEERRGVDDDDVVRLPGHLEQLQHLRLGDELGVLRAHRRRQDVEPGPVSGRVAGELAGVEPAGSQHELVHRPLRVEAEHDRGVAELQVEVDQEHALARLVREVAPRGSSRARSCRCRPSARTRSRPGRELRPSFEAVAATGRRSRAPCGSRTRSSPPAAAGRARRRHPP